MAFPRANLIWLKREWGGDVTLRLLIYCKSSTFLNLGTHVEMSVENTSNHPYPDSVWSKELIWCARRSIYDESIKFSPGHVRQELLDEAIPDFHGMAKGAGFAVSHLTGCQKSSWHTVWCGLPIGLFFCLHVSFGDVGDTWTLGFWTLLCVRKKV